MNSKARKNAARGNQVMEGQMELGTIAVDCLDNDNADEIVYEAQMNAIQSSQNNQGGEINNNNNVPLDVNAILEASSIVGNNNGRGNINMNNMRNVNAGAATNVAMQNYNAQLDQIALAKALQESVSTISSMQKEMVGVQQNKFKEKQTKTIGWVILLSVILTFNTLSNVYVLFFYHPTCDCDASETVVASDSITVGDDSKTPTVSPTEVIIMDDPTTTEAQATTIVTTEAGDHETTAMPSNRPTSSPTRDPTTTAPSIKPTVAPSVLILKTPSRIPSNEPTTMPTVYDGNTIGDFKMSFLNESHDYWLLCDGSFINNRDYPLLFDVIGFTFGSSGDSSNLFQLPDTTGKFVMNQGTYEQSHYIGEIIDENKDEYVTLTESNLAAHTHYTITEYGNGGTCWDTTLDYNGFNSPYVYTAQYCSIWDANENFRYQLRGTSTEANTGLSSDTGSGEPFSIMPPTLVIGNTFIYAGEFCDSC